MKAIFDLAVQTFHFRRSFDHCLSGISYLDSFERAPASRRDSPIKIRQDLLATSAVIELALHLRRFSEISNAEKAIRGRTVSLHELKYFAATKKTENLTADSSLYSLVSKLVHSKTCVVSRNMVAVFSHFDAKTIPKNILNGALATAAAIVVDSKDDAKKFCFLREFLDESYSFIWAICEKNDDLKRYANTRQI